MIESNFPFSFKQRRKFEVQEIDLVAFGMDVIAVIASVKMRIGAIAIIIIIKMMMAMIG